MEVRTRPTPCSVAPGLDGVVFEYRHLSQHVFTAGMEQLPQPHQFMKHLKRKAGLPDDFWADNVKLSRYSSSN